MVVGLQHSKSFSVMVNLAQLDHPIKSKIVTSSIKTKRLPKLSASLTSMNTLSSVLTSTLDKKHFSKWDQIMMIMSSVKVEELNHLRSLLTSS